MDEEITDKEITFLFQQWLVAFANTQSAEDDEESAAVLARIESRIAATPAELLRRTAHRPADDGGIQTRDRKAPSWTCFEGL
jgi:hypothetical protein